MVDVQRIWRVGAADKAVQVTLTSFGNSSRQVSVTLPGGGVRQEQSFDIDVARAVAQAILEACEISSTLATTDTYVPAEVRVP